MELEELAFCLRGSAESLWFVVGARGGSWMAGGVG